MSARVVFGNLPREAGGSEVRELAEEAGAVRHVELLQDADTGAFNGVAVVEYQSAEIARAAIEHHDFELSGRRLWVREDREDPASQRAPQPRKYLRAFGGRGAGGRGAGYSAGSGSCRMVLGNLPYEVTWMEVKDFCREVAEPVHVAMTGNGVAVVEFHSPMDSRTAITRLHDRELHGRLVWAREDRDLPAAGRGGGFAGRGGGFAGRGGGGFGGGGPGARGNRVVIGNLPYFATWQQTKDLCRCALGGRVLCGAAAGSVRFSTSSCCRTGTPEHPKGSPSSSSPNPKRPTARSGTCTTHRSQGLTG
eukprot:TRINITY_DN1077_c0_g1_i2.p3 TRINITY_DN1077_c0_g1~~TRINITY_DN1077_c0_g1_i2.p3  ORF type:complete len:307 (+),score=75.70 TRINITY_DN1077_c0_g1_i2:46-966(+)